MLLLPAALTLPQGGGELAGAAMFGLLTLVNYQSEAKSSPAPYSKFSIAGEKESGGKEARVSGRKGMLVIYAPALVAMGLISAGTSSQIDGDRAILVNALLIAHFAKRCIETLFVHRYSGTMPLAASVGIGAYYTLVSAAIASLRCATPQPQAAALGVALFVVGSLGNLYHHWLLATLRPASSSSAPAAAADRVKTYQVPTGGLFSMVAMPHYLFELVAWLGIAVASQHLNAFLVFSAMASYLAGRSVASSRWNAANIPNYPRDRRHLVPGIF